MYSCVFSHTRPNRFSQTVISNLYGLNQQYTRYRITTMQPLKRRQIIMWSRGSKWEPVEVGERQANKAILNRTITWSECAWQPAFRVLSWIIYRPQPKDCTSIPHHLPHRRVFLGLSFRTTFLLLSTGLLLQTIPPLNDCILASQSLTTVSSWFPVFPLFYSKYTASHCIPPLLTLVTPSPLPADSPCCSSPVAPTLLCFHLLRLSPDFCSDGSTLSGCDLMHKPKTSTLLGRHL